MKSEKKLMLERFKAYEKKIQMQREQLKEAQQIMNK
jgi:hypothetical protein